jgi:hypothetical protein
VNVNVVVAITAIIAIYMLLSCCRRRAPTELLIIHFLSILNRSDDSTDIGQIIGLDAQLGQMKLMCVGFGLCQHNESPESSRVRDTLNCRLSS